MAKSIMNKSIILSATIILLCFAVFYVFDNRTRYAKLSNGYKLQQKELKDLAWELGESKEVSAKRKARIEQLSSGYPTGIWGCDNSVDRIIFKQEIRNPTLQKIIAELNEANKSSKLPNIIFLEQNKNSVHLTVSDSEQLTERMGSSGAMCYLGEVVYSVTSFDDIDAVIFEFEEGSHAIPGKYYRIDFES